MRHSYHLSNFIHQVRAAQQMLKPTFTYSPSSNFIVENTRLLLREGLISGYRLQNHFRVPNASTITLFLRYMDNRRPLITHIRTYTTPGQTFLYSFKKILSLRRRSSSHVISFYVFSTSIGLLTDHECAKHGVGGRLLYSVNYCP
jgi:ribosomal protein S8